MTISRHPDDAVLFDYASGALDEAWSLAIATHLSLCPVCRAAVERIEAVGGELLDLEPEAQVAPSSLEAMMARLDDEPAPERPMPPRPIRRSGVLPEPLRSYVGGDIDAVRWRALGGGAAQCILSIPNSNVTARLLRIPAGRPVPEHSHRGAEITLVLAGAFEDATGLYARGDLQEADATLQHQPHATPGEDCICLAVTDAPLRFRALLPRIAQRFLRI